MKVQMETAFKIPMITKMLWEKQNKNKKIHLHEPLISQPRRAICGCFPYLALSWMKAICYKHH